MIEKIRGIFVYGFRKLFFIKRNMKNKKNTKNMFDSHLFSLL